MMREQRRDNRWVDMGQQHNPRERFASRFDGGEVPDPIDPDGWGGERCYGHDDDGYGEALA